MSSRCYPIVGFGIATEDIEPYLDEQKCITELKRLLPDEEINPETFLLENLSDYMYGEPFDDFGDFLCQMDDTGMLTYSSASGYSYCYYPPSYPWEMSSGEPASEAEVHEIIANALNRVCNISKDEVCRLVHYISDCEFG